MIYRDATQPGTDWFNGDNWYNATTSNNAWIPAPDDIVYIGDATYLVNATVDIATSQGLATAGMLTLGRDLGSTGALNLSDGLLQVSGYLTVGGDGTGALSQTGGSLQTAATGVGAPVLVDPTLPSSGHFDQTGGTHIISPDESGEVSALGVGAGIGGTGSYSLSGADPQLQAPATVVGFVGGAGAFTQTAGTHLITSDYAPVGPLVSGLDFPGLFLGFGWVVEEGTGEDIDVGYPSTGSYALTGGALTITRAPAVADLEPPVGAVVWLGTSGTGTLLLGDANGTGTLNEADPPSPTGDEVGVSLFLRPSPFEGGDTATLRGWGAPSLTGVLLNNGRVIADGYGQDRDLDLRNFSLVASSAGLVNVPLLQSDGTQAGWYAQDHGRLLLPTYTEATQTGWAVLWGTAPLFGGGVTRARRSTH
jgi:hypothetical protein